MQRDHTGRTFRRGGVFVVAVLLILLATLVAVSGSAPRLPSPSSGLGLATTPVSITQFSLSPSTVTQNTQVSGMVSLSGGTPPYFLWFNNTPPGCSPQSNPVNSPSATYSFQCNPTSTGSYNIHLDVTDSSVPVSKASSGASLNVQSSGNGNGNGNGNNSNSGNNSLSSLFPSSFLEIGIILVLVFMGTMVAIAAGVVAIAVLVPRRLRQLNETLAKTGLPPKEPKPPT